MIQTRFFEIFFFVYFLRRLFFFCCSFRFVFLIIRGSFARSPSNVKRKNFYEHYDFVFASLCCFACPKRWNKTRIANGEIYFKFENTRQSKSCSIVSSIFSFSEVKYFSFCVTCSCTAYTTFHIHKPNEKQRRREKSIRNSSLWKRQTTNLFSCSTVTHRTKWSIANDFDLYIDRSRKQQEGKKWFSFCLCAHVHGAHRSQQQVSLRVIG